jgi:hypothetical protein
MLIVAAIAIATPAFAAVTFDAEQLDPNRKVVSIKYSGPSDPNVRAFALDISVDSGAVIGDILADSFFKGEGLGYGIFPGRFRDYIDAANPNWVDINYTPVAPGGDPDAAGVLGSGAITIELGSLYVNGPIPKSGTLCKLLISSSAFDCNITIAANTTRGGVVNEDATAASTNLPFSKKLLFGSAPVAPTILYGTYDPDCNVPIYWGPVADATSYDVEAQLNGGAWGNIYSGPLMKVMHNTNSTTGNYVYRARANNAFGSSAWTTGGTCVVVLSTCYKTPADPNYASWIAVGRPDCWCGGTAGSAFQCDGDSDGVTSGAPFQYRVFSGDLTYLTKNWQKVATAFTWDPNWTTNTAGKKVHNACADTDHKSSGAPFQYRVFSNDLTLLTKNWQKKDSQLPGACPR